MNKLIFFCLLSLLIVYTQSTACNSIGEVESKDGCKDGEVASGKVCEYQPPAEGKEKGTCKEVDKPATTTNSSDNLNIFKITLTLLIIFTIL